MKTHCLCNNTVRSHAPLPSHDSIPAQPFRLLSERPRNRFSCPKRVPKKESSFGRFCCSRFSTLLHGLSGVGRQANSTPSCLLSRCVELPSSPRATVRRRPTNHGHPLNGFLITSAPACLAVVSKVTLMIIKQSNPLGCKVA